jgi:hypothetical protein
MTGTVFVSSCFSFRGDLPMAVLVQALAFSLTDPYYLHIGAIVHKWATMEYLLQNIIWRAMGLDREQGRVLTIGMGVEVLSGVLRNLPRKWITDQKIKDDLQALLKLVKDHVEYRNYLVHGVWTADLEKKDDPPWLNYMKTGEQRIMPGAEQLSPESLHNFALVIEQMNERARLILQALGGPQPPSPNKSE